MARALGLNRPIVPTARCLPRRHCSAATAVNNRPIGKLVTKTFFSDVTSWTAPITTVRLESLVGNGAAGTPASSYEMPTWQIVYNTTYYKRAGGTDVVTEFGSIVDGAPPRGDYCDPFVTDDSSVPYSGWQKCYYYLTSSRTVFVSATTGASATAFSKTFPGGNGGPATPDPHTSVAITPGASYQFVIPPGGSITITYYE